ncbi:MAG TPA: D-alanyl-D-alanine carboxypeptidase family protein [Pyrinomonadaceae bacterium]|nr:D-alanyl-D-alanine carboxypeptidase family protein [Pyrinomonadaceae bacterium]
MKHYKNHAVVLFVAFATLVCLAALAATAARSQSQLIDKASASATRPSNVQPTAAIRERRAQPLAGEEAQPSFGPLTTTRNLLLKNDLNWVFGGKQQRGWYLYEPLIGRLLETEKDAGTSDFASALARWQKTYGLLPSGVLDDETLYQMVSTWQSTRIKDKSYPQPHQLVTAPISDFYDPTRPEELRQVEREAYTAYKRMIAAAIADPSLGLAATPAGELAPSERYMKIISSFRSREYQERLRKQSPNSGRAGLALHSPHFTGRALDIYVGGEPVETKDANRALQVQTRVYKWLVRNADKFGFRPYYYEPWHWEYCPETTVSSKK